MKLTTLLLFCGITAFAQNLTFTPTHPVPGDSILVEYTSDQLPSKTQDIQMVAYYFDNISMGLSEVKELEWTKEQERFVAKTPSTNEAIALLIRVLPKDATSRESTHGAGYAVSFYEADRMTLRRGAIFAQGQMHAFYGNHKGLQKSSEQADSLFERSFEKYPDIRKNSMAYNSFLNHKIKTDLVAAKLLTKQWVNNILEKPNPSKAEILNCYNITLLLWLSQSSTLFKKLSRKLIKFGMKQYPDKSLESTYLSNKSFVEPNVNSKKQYLKKLRNYQAEGVENQKSIDNVLSQVAIKYFQQSPSKGRKFFDEIEGNGVKINTSMFIANNSAKQTIQRSEKHLQEGLFYAKKTVELLEIEKEITVQKPKILTKRWYQNKVDDQINRASESQALILFRLGKREQALAIQNEICTRDRFTNSRYVEQYCEFLELTKGPEKTLTTLFRLNRSNINSAKMDKQLWRLFIEQGGTRAEFEAKMSAINASIITQPMNDLTEKMIKNPAPIFTLKNLSGEEVSSEDLKGKIVVLDFWASWCAPCKASFPAMQKLVDIYAKRDDVVFLFIDTWEGGKNKITPAKIYTIDKGFRFNVLLDVNNKVVNDFGVSAVPTKFVIDKAGNIRFKSNGFLGEKQTIEELSLMIEMVAQQ